MKRVSLTQASIAASVLKLKAVLKYLTDLLLLATGAPRPDGWEKDLVIQHVQEMTLEEFRLHKFKTNDLIELPPFGLKEGTVIINGIPLQLKLVEVLVVYALLEHGRAAKSTRRPNSSFLPVGDIIASIDRVRAREQITVGENITEPDIYKAVDTFREKLLTADLNEHLLEGKRGQGYRLSTPHWNLIIHSPTAPFASLAQV